jgi:hypothetical protein
MTDQEFLDAVVKELKNARSKFPDSAASHAALVEEVGELSKALMYEPFNNVVAEAVQVATMALRVAVEGDSTMRHFRYVKVHDRGTRYLNPEAIMPGDLVE